MKDSYVTNLSLPKVDFALLFFRVAISGFMLSHGIGKVILFFGDDPIVFVDPIGLGEIASFTLVIFAEVICSIMIILGLGTRLAVIPLIITMIVAVFVHTPQGMSKQELPFIYMLSYFLLFYAGSGRYSLDHYLFNKKKVAK